MQPHAKISPYPPQSVEDHTDTLIEPDPHEEYRREDEDHSHQSTGLQAGKIDHGAALLGLGDDDHTQYFLADGSRNLGGDLKFSGDTILHRAAADVLELVRGANRQELRIYEGLAGGDYYYLSIGCITGNVMQIRGTSVGSGGPLAPMNLYISAIGPYPAKGLVFDSGGTQIQVRGLSVSHQAGVLDGGVSWTFVNTTDAQYWAFGADAANFIIYKAGALNLVLFNRGQAFVDSVVGYSFKFNEDLAGDFKLLFDGSYILFGATNTVKVLHSANKLGINKSMDVTLRLSMADVTVATRPFALMMG